MLAHGSGEVAQRVGAIGLAVVAAGLAALVLAARRLGRRARLRLAFFAGAAAVSAAVSSESFDAWSDSSLTNHMIQHLVIVLVAAPCLAAGEPLAVLAAHGPPPVRRVWRRAHLRHRRLVRSVLGAVAVTLPFVVVMSAWHSPSWYDAAVDDDLVHVAEHASLLATAALAWSVLPFADLWRRRKRRVTSFPIAAVAGLLLMMLHGAVVGLWLLVVPVQLYSSPPGASVGWRAVSDQQASGAVLWGVGGTAMMAATVALLGWWIAGHLRPERLVLP